MLPIQTGRPSKAEDSRSLQAKKTSSTLTAFRQFPSLWFTGSHDMAQGVVRTHLAIQRD